MHVCCSSNPLAKDFLDLIVSFNFVQHVQGPTHEKGHTLDLILSLGLSVGDIEIQNSVFSDHIFILIRIFTSCVTQIICPPAHQVRYVTTAAIKRFKTLFFESDIFGVLDGSCDVNAAFDIFNST